MSTATQETFTGFAEAKVSKLPALSCVGTVEEVGEGKLSSTENYVVQPISIRATGPGRSITFRILYRPEWFEPTFDPNSLEEYGPEGSKMLAVYRKNIAAKGGIAALKGLAGSEENYVKLAKALLTAQDKSIEGVRETLRTFFSENDVEVGYVLKQRKDKVGEDENGKGIYELANGYEVGEFYFPTAENLKKQVQRANRSKDGSFRVAFDQE